MDDGDNVTNNDDDNVNSNNNIINNDNDHQPKDNDGACNEVVTTFTKRTYVTLMANFIHSYELSRVNKH